MELQERITKIKELETEMYKAMLSSFKTSLVFDTRISTFLRVFGNLQVRQDSSNDEKRFIEDTFIKAKKFSEKQIEDKDKLQETFDIRSYEYMKKLVIFIDQLDRAKLVVSRTNKFQDLMDYYNAVKEQNEKTYENFVEFLEYVNGIGFLSKDKFVQEKLESLLQYFELIIHNSPVLDEEKFKEAYVDYTRKKEEDTARQEEKLMYEKLAREQKQEDENFVKGVNDRFNELKLIKTKLGSLNADRIVEIVLLIEQFIADLEKLYGEFPLKLNETDFLNIMYAKEDVENAKNYVNERTNVLFERYKNAEENFVEDLKEKPNGSIKDMFEEFRGKVELLRNKYGTIEVKQDYTPEEIENIARAYAATESISEFLDKIRESNHFTYGIVK